MTEEKKMNNNIGTPYDDVFRTIITDCPHLLIPMVNEVFQLKIPMDTPVLALQNEMFITTFDGNTKERITDSDLMIASERYHFECQSRPDSSMNYRTFEYDSQMALRDSHVVGGKLVVKFPNTAIVYLRHTKNTPDMSTIIIRTKTNECNHDVKMLKVGNYTIDEIFKKKLFFLIPFHIFVYEKDFEEYEKDKEKREELVDVYENILKRLNICLRQGSIDLYTKYTLIQLSKKVLNQIARKYTLVKESVGDVMGGKILDYPAKDILRQGITQGIAQGITEGRIRKLISLVCKKMPKGYTVSDIIDFWEEDPELIHQIYDMAKSLAPDYDEDKIYEQLKVE